MKIRTAALLALITILIIANLEAKIIYRLDLLMHNFNGYLGVAVYLAIWAVFLLSLYAIMHLPNGILKTVLIILYSIGTAGGLAYETIAATQIDYDSLSILFEAFNHAGDAIQFYLGILLGSLIAAILFGAILWFTKPDLLRFRTNKYIQNIFVKLVACTPLVLVFILAMSRGGYGTDGLPNQIKVPALAALITVNRLVYGESTHPAPPVDNSLRSKSINIVLVVDESVRGDFIDLNDNKGVTPSLLEYQDRVINFGYAVSGANCSAGSNVILRWGLNKNIIRENKVDSAPYIWEYARNAGYVTTYLEAQAKEGRFNDRMTLAEKNRIDDYVYSPGKTRIQRDLNSIDILRNKLAASENNFIYLVKSGVHFPYESAYDESTAKFKPHMSGTQFVANKEELINSYKNAIDQSIEPFFRKLLTLDLSNTVIIYTSDHGQSLLDSSSQLTHCSKSDTAIQEALVPLMVFTGVKDIESIFVQSAQLNKDKTSHFNIFPTILELMGYSENYIQSVSPHSSLTQPINEKRSFVVGVLAEPRLTFGNHEFQINWRAYD